MTQVYTGEGKLLPVTVIAAGPCTVTQKKTVTRDGYCAVQLGGGEQKAQRLTAADRGHRQKSGRLSADLREFRVDDTDLEVGQQIGVGDLFKAGDLVDVTGVSKGRGFSGVIKRHNFAGFPGSHGTHETFRHGGSIGNRSYPGRVFKGKRMAGQLGNRRVTTQNLKVVEVRAEENLILVCGAVPGADHGTLLIRPAVKAREVQNG
jgi:large subunit ribosomal protein L3